MNLDRKTKLVVLHAHHSNIDFTEAALQDANVEQIHHVDPGFIDVIKNKSKHQIEKRVQTQLEWLAASKPDAILITCTNYSLYIKGSEINDIPILKIDELFFQSLLDYSNVTLYFTNDETVEGTTHRLKDYFKQVKSKVDFQVKLIDHAFELLMSNKHDAYSKVIVDYIGKNPTQGHIVFPQLSMHQAATHLKSKGFNVITPVDTLKKAEIYMRQI
ncbi:hypothetical protein SAMN04487943_105100 [Gracilibacillus orientalis]|uniref:Asp/Glu/Hydantoin racemase n=1 Tax=Gracilibacillus orientalis TaxID=334253 RepID=A0A1I4LMT4_9BACI|nr:hypothetical protein [Gracilibacillus orientalis]SFL92123.1 hypothetical protein SAMN04487943_105100 [Gracilibacillus orientalis]